MDLNKTLKHPIYVDKTNDTHNIYLLGRNTKNKDPKILKLKSLGLITRILHESLHIFVFIVNTYIV